MVAFVMGVLLCLVLIACANVTTLLLSRADARQRELAVRLALGAGRMRLVRMLLTETLLLAAMAGIGSVYLAYRVPILLRDWLVKRPLEYSLDPDWRVFIYLTALTVLAGVAAGLAPALESLRVDLIESLKDRRGFFGGPKHRSFRPWLVGTQVALSLVLVTGAGLFVLQHYRLRTSDPGFETRQVVLLQVTPKSNSQQLALTSPSFHEAIDARVRSLPGLQSLAFASSSPGFEPDTVDISVQGARPRQAALNEVSPGFFTTLGIAILRGRALDVLDPPCGPAPCRVVVSKAFAREYLVPDDGIGQTIDMPGGVRGEVVGIAGPTLAGPLLAEPAIVYRPWTPSARRYQGFARFVGDPDAFATAAFAAIRNVEPQSLTQVRTLQSFIDDTATELWRMEVLVVILGGVAAALAVIGVYGVTSFSVSCRTRELGVRIALGARTGDVYVTVFGSGIRVVGASLCVGVVLTMLTALGLSHISRPGQPGIEPFDPVAYVAVTVLLTCVIGVAMAIPARRAASIAPIDALRQE